MVPGEDWKAYLIKEGSKGPMVTEFAFRRVVEVRDELLDRGCSWSCVVLWGKSPNSQPPQHRTGGYPSHRIGAHSGIALAGGNRPGEWERWPGHG